MARRILGGWRSALVILKPGTVIAWHRKGFRLYWKWKSRHPVGRPSVSLEIIDLIHWMSLANRGWGAPRIQEELLKLRFQLSQATVAKYLVRHRRPPSQNWRTFLKNHLQSLVSTDFFVVPTIMFRLLFVFVILSHDRRRPIHLAVTANPTAEWMTRQLFEALRWDSAPRYLHRDRYACYGKEFHEATKWLGLHRGRSEPLVFCESTFWQFLRSAGAFCLGSHFFRWRCAPDAY